MRRARSTLILLVAFVGLAAYAYFVESERPSRAEAENTKESAFSIEPDAMTELQLKASSGEQTSLRRVDGTWRLTAPVSAGADETEVSGLTSGLASLEIERIVEEEAGDLEPFGLAEPSIEISFKTAETANFTRLLIGDETVTGGDRYAKLGDQDRVFLIAAYLDGSFDRTTFDLRDKSILEFNRDDVDRLELTAEPNAMELVKEDDEWRMRRPWEARGEFSSVEGLVGRLSTGEMQSLVESDASEVGSFGLDTPRATVTVGTGSSRATLEVGSETDEGTSYARDVARSLVFTIESSLVDDLSRAPSEYRRKDVFAFRSYNATRLEVERDGEHVAFEKTADADASEQRLWQRVEPSTAEIDQTKFGDLLSTLSNLRAESFTESRQDAGLDSPAATVTVQFGDDNDEERVIFGKVGEDVYAAGGGDSGAAKIDASEFDTALSMLDELE